MGALFALAAVALAAMSARAQSVDDPGIAAPAVAGRVVAEGRCPVPLGDSDNGTCVDRPFPTTVVVRTSDGLQQVTSVATADDGTFSVALQPGEYRLEALQGDGLPSATASAVVDVPADQIVPVLLRIRGNAAGRTVP